MDLIRSSQNACKTPPSSSTFTTQIHPSHNYPIIVVAIIGILATALLLLGYYIFVIKCCLNWHRIDLLRRFSLSRNRHNENPLIGYTQDIESKGLDDYVIRSIRTFQFKKAQEQEKGCSLECAVCLNEFHEGDKVKAIPNCGHVFHIDCIDIWLQNNANCPLCRTSISLTSQYPNQLINISPTSHQAQGQYDGSFIHYDEDFVVIELEEESSNQSLLRVQERFKSTSSPKKLEPKILEKRGKRLGHVTSFGDEFIGTRGKDERLLVQPHRRSLSVDSGDDRQFYFAVQEIVKRNKNGNAHHDIVSSTNECCSSTIQRPLLYLESGGARRAVSPIHL